MDDSTLYKMEEKKDTLKFNLVVMGDQYSGKSSIVQRFADGTFGPTYIQTRGSGYRKKTVTINGATVTLYVYDTAGQVDMKTVIKSIYRRAQGILLVFDFSREDTLNHIKDWMDLIQSNCDVVPEFLLVGNKIDLNEAYRFPRDQATSIADGNGIEFLEVSAKRDINIEKAFVNLTNKVFKNKERFFIERQDSIVLHKPVEEEPSCCNSS